MPQDADSAESPGRQVRLLHVEPGRKLDPLLRARLLDMTRRVRAARVNYDAQSIAECLAEGAIYESQDALTPIIGGVNIASYLRERFAAIREMTATRGDLDIHLGEVALPRGADYPCLIFSRDGVNMALWVITLDNEDRISRLDILTVAPPPDTASRLAG